MSNTAQLLSAEVRAAVELRRWLENERASDPQFDDLVLDAIEGETRLNELVAAILREALLKEKMAEACAERAKEIEAREERLLRGAESLRRAAGRAMDEARVPNITAPDLTITYRHGTLNPFVEDASLLPDQFVRTTTVKTPDMKAIRQYGKPIPGVVMRNGAPVLTVRGK